MKMSVYNSITFFPPLLILFILASCNSESASAINMDSTYSLTGKVIVFQGDSNVKYEDNIGSLRTIASNLGIPVLTGGYRGSYIRIWAWDFGEDKFVIDIKRYKRDTTCTIIDFTPVRKKATSYIVIHQKKNITPASGWTKFFDSLDRVIKMPSAKLTIEQRTNGSASEWIEFEIDQLDEYRFIKFLEPFEFRNEDSTSAKIYSFLTFFNKEMGTNIYDYNKRFSSK